MRQQVERLKDAAKASGDISTAKSLEQLLSRANRASELAPSKLTQSRGVVISGEELTPNTPTPVDKETAAPLADIIFPSMLPTEMPLFDESLSSAAQTLVLEWRNSHLLHAFDVEPARTCLIYGAPGTGKTSLALWLARKLELPVVVARLDGLISSFLGTTARNVGNLFSFANRYRCLLVLDEFDAVAKVRDDPHEVGEIKRVVNAILQNIDSRKGVGLTIAVTNHEKLLDPAIWRRFEIQLHVPKPSFNGRLAIIKRYLSPVVLNESVERLLAWITEGLSGAEVETFVKGMKKYFAISGAGTDDILGAFRHLVSINGEKIKSDRAELMNLDQQGFATSISKHSDLNLSRADVAALLNKDKGTISRWLKAAV